MHLTQPCAPGYLYCTLSNSSIIRLHNENNHFHRHRFDQTVSGTKVCLRSVPPIFKANNAQKMAREETCFTESDEVSGSASIF